MSPTQVSWRGAVALAGEPPSCADDGAAAVAGDWRVGARVTLASTAPQVLAPASRKQAP